MSISYPLSLPSSPAIRSARFELRAISAITVSPWTGEAQVQAGQNELWRVSVELPPMPRSLAEAWTSFLLSLDGVVGTFLLGDPDAGTARGVATGTPRVDGASQTGKELATKGWTTGTTNILRAGDYIQLGNRLYKVMKDASSDGNGDATLDIRPRLRESPSDSDLITVSNCVGLFRLADNLQSAWSSDEASVYGIAFDAMEAV